MALIFPNRFLRNHGLAMLCEVAVSPLGPDFLVKSDISTLLCHLGSTLNASKLAESHQSSREVDAFSSNIGMHCCCLARAQVLHSLSWFPCSIDVATCVADILKRVGPRLRPVLRILAILAKRALDKSNPLPREPLRRLLLSVSCVVMDLAAWIDGSFRGLSAVQHVA